MKTTHTDYLRQIAAVSSIALILVFAWLAPLDDAANQQIDTGLKRALVSFATARALNGIISVAQGTQLAVEPGGVGLVFAPGQLLEPINELVEQFSDLMLGASIAFGIQKVLVSIGAHWLSSLLLSFVALAGATLYWRRQSFPAWLARLLLALLMIRFAIPIVTIGSDALFREFMAADYQASQQAIDLTSGQLATFATPASATDGGQASTLEKFKSWWAQNADLKAQVDKLKQGAEQAAEHIVRLMAIFLLQTLVIPLLLLWILYAFARSLLSFPARPPPY
jgi:hypothetical protein